MCMILNDICRILTMIMAYYSCPMHLNHLSYKKRCKTELGAILITDKKTQLCILIKNLILKEGSLKENDTK